eukprot:CAMPEP_0183358184 /NCGR_PEP_ID=MMETSP0164_2-20130417/48465_1 /TAXON_ID=221442 /ORGANISM="Coccolithus pelagicus ssp braarudi, Strain PLY182g" /LENGTH=286 /DNA_ID=CAMNT_0025532029 /DNA_START=141 /DNA_END=997 /DNA_ORIENTATION=+
MRQPQLSRPQRVRSNRREIPVSASLPQLSAAHPSLLQAVTSSLSSSTKLYKHVMSPVESASHLEYMELFPEPPSSSTRPSTCPSKIECAPLSPHSVAPNQPGMGIPTTVFTFMKAMLGPLLLYAPFMFAQVGWLIATVGFIVTGTLSAAGMLQLVAAHEAIDRERQSSAAGGYGGRYTEVGRRAVGWLGFHLVEWCLVISQWLYCVGYPIFVARNMQQVVAVAFPHTTPPTILALTLAQLPVLVPYCWVRDIRCLGYPMLVANLCLWGSLVTIMYIVGRNLGADVA